MRPIKLPQDYIDSLEEARQVRYAIPISDDVLRAKQEYSREIYGGLRQWFRQEMSVSIDHCLDTFEGLIPYYQFFDKNVKDDNTSLILLYKTSLKRLKQYHICCVKALRDQQAFPVWSMFRSMVETIGVLCYINSNPSSAKEWVGFDDKGVIEKFGVPTTRRLLEVCRTKQYDKVGQKGFLPIHKNQKHMDRITLEMWDHFNKIDHMSFETISVVFRKYIVPENKMVLIEMEDGLEVDESMYTMLGFFWVLVAEGFNHLGLVGRHLQLPAQRILEDITRSLKDIARSNA